MLRELYAEKPLPPRALDRYSDVVHRILDVRSDAELGSLVRGPLQKFIGHDVMVVAWGDFDAGAVRCDFYSADSTIQANNVEADVLYPMLDSLFKSWLGCGRSPLVINAQGLGEGWALRLPGVQSLGALPVMQSVLVHGSQNQRGRQDCLYAFFSATPKDFHDETYAAKILVPYIDFALRQISLPVAPSEGEGLKGQAGSVLVEEDRPAALTEREAEIMKWVALGKTNSEIGGILNLSSFTVKNHMQRIFKKLDVFNRVQAVAVFRARHVTSS